jgi:hypothetical protein
VESYRYLEQTAAALDHLHTREEIERLLDEPEAIHEVLKPEFQTLASELIDKITKRL